MESKPSDKPSRNFCETAGTDPRDVPWRGMSNAILSQMTLKLAAFGTDPETDTIPAVQGGFFNLLFWTLVSSPLLGRPGLHPRLLIFSFNDSG